MYGYDAGVSPVTSCLGLATFDSSRVSSTHCWVYTLVVSPIPSPIDTMPTTAYPGDFTSARAAYGRSRRISFRYSTGSRSTRSAISRISPNAPCLFATSSMASSPACIISSPYASLNSCGKAAASRR